MNFRLDWLATPYCRRGRCSSMLRPKGMMNHLREADIGTCIHHPIPLHLRKAFASPDYRLGDFPVTEKAATKILSLPISAQLSAEQQARVVEKILNFADIASVSEQATDELVPMAVHERNSIESLGRSRFAAANIA